MPIYSDINQYTPTTKETLPDVESVYQSINNILTTRVGERFFNPEFGSELEELIHEPMDETTVAEIYSYVIHAIERWEPRVRLNYAYCTVEPNYDEQRYDVVLAFTILGFEEQEFEHRGVIEQ